MKTIKRNWIALFGICGSGLVIIATALTALSQTAPVLTIAPLGGNQFSVGITNGVATTNYTLYWTPSLNDPAYPWQFLNVGSLGQTNFTIDGGTWPGAFFRILVGIDQDGDGVADWQDAAPNDPTIGILTVVIDSPANGAVLQ